MLQGPDDNCGPSCVQGGCLHDSTGMREDYLEVKEQRKTKIPPLNFVGILQHLQSQWEKESRDLNGKCLTTHGGNFTLMHHTAKLKHGTELPSLFRRETRRPDPERADWGGGVESLLFVYSVCVTACTQREGMAAHLSKEN
ncbi:hypothetical protein GN956_G21651 [Arapaima gigas]